MKDDNKEKVFKIVQSFLKDPPLIVWGSGATIPFGLPSMNDLNEVLKKKFSGFNAENSNLEIELEKDQYKEKTPKIKQAIWEEVNGADILVLEQILSNNTDKFNGIKLLIEKFIDVHPEVVNIVTTNYDRVLEYIMSYHNFPYTDGFNGKVLSIFDEDKFKKEKIVNLLKVHGSLNWFDVNGEIRFLSCKTANKIPQIVVPSKNKYQESYYSPYRELIQKADGLIKKTSSFFVVGFGFNDEHLTPKIKEKINNGTPIVLITKKVSDNSFKQLENAKKYILFEKSENGKTKVTYKENSSTQKQVIELEYDLWQLNNFMKIL